MLDISTKSLAEETLSK